MHLVDSLDFNIPHTTEPNQPRKAESNLQFRPAAFADISPAHSGPVPVVAADCGNAAGDKVADLRCADGEEMHCNVFAL